MDEQDNCYIPANESIRREFHSDLKNIRFDDLRFDSMDEKNRNKLDILYIQFLNFSIFPHLYSIYTPSSANSANFTNIGFHKARVFRSNIPLTFDSSDTKKYPSSRIMAFEAELSFLACPDPRKRKGRGKNIYPHTFSVQREIIQRHVVPRQALKSFQPRY